MTIYGVTGATGALGRHAIRELMVRSVPAADIVALARTPNKAAQLVDIGVQVRTADYTDLPSLTAALANVDRLLLISSSQAGERVAHHTNVINASTGTAVTRIVYTSMLKADYSTNPLAHEHVATESLLRASGMPFILLRNGWYLENYTDQLETYLQRGEIVGAARDGAVSAATRCDFAAAAAAALLQDDVSQQTYELGGPRFTLAELAQVITEVAGSRVIYRDLSVEEYAAELQREGLDRANALFLASLDDSIARNDLSTSSQDLAGLLRRAPTSLVDAVRAAYAGARAE